MPAYQLLHPLMVLMEYSGHYLQMVKLPDYCCAVPLRMVMML